MMSSNITLYILVFIAIVVALTVIKKVTSCLVKSVALLVIIGIVAFLYFTYFSH